MPSQVPTSQRLAGIDYGTVRIGIAVTDAEQRICSPFENYTRRGAKADAQHFEQFAREEQIATFVVGLPVHLHGGESQKSTEARAFGKWLHELTSVPVVFFDERFTTSEAEQLLGQAELTKKKRKAKLDKLAAQIMLSAFMESRRHGDDNLRGLDE